MSSSPDDRDELEQFVHRTLRDLPLRRAPQSLAASVLAELERRASRPWWGRSFAHWPVPARVAFILFSAVVVKFVLMTAVWAMAGFDSAQFHDAFAAQIGWMERGLAVVDAIGGFFDILARNIPPLWLYGGLAFIAAMYGALFGLGAVAYRALHAQR